VDEAGRGPLAGPVVAAAVIWPENRRPPKGLNDSKQVIHEERERMFQDILDRGDAVGVGVATAREIDAVNILQATRLAARRALDALPVVPDAVLTDYLLLPGYPRPVEPIVDGDCLSVSIAAASIVAKVFRDRIMDHYAEEYPGYSWHTNRGYGTPEHLDALARLGPTTLHRLTFAGVGFFSEQLRPSRTFLSYWESNVVRELSPSPEAQLAGGWCLRSRITENPLPYEHVVHPLVARAWAGSLAEEHRIVCLDEEEARAIDIRMRNAEYTPDWLPR